MNLTLAFLAGIYPDSSLQESLGARRTPVSFEMATGTRGEGSLI